MPIWHTSNNVLKDSGQNTVRSKTFAIPIQLKGCKTNTIYQFLVNGINMGWACKPFGGILGGPLTSNNQGVLKFIVHFDQRHSTGLISTSSDASTILNSQLKCEAIDPIGISTIFYLPLTLKPTQ